MNKLLVGYGERTITPPLGVDLCGYGFYLDRKAEGVLDDLKVRALYLKNGGRALLLTSCDLIGLTVEFCDEVRAAAAAAQQIPAAHILLSATHTHSGPATQPLPGLGEVDAASTKKIRKSVLEAAADASSDLQESDFSVAFEAIEAIGYNRRRNDFSGIDPVLKAGIFRTGREKIYLLNYACHPVVFGPQKNISADWPGTLVRAVEKSGQRAVFFQGFCGDIDPVTQLNRWGRGTIEDLNFYGELLRQRLEKAEKFAVLQADTGLAAVEKRLTLPLQVYDRRRIEREAASFLEKNARFPGAQRFAEEWRKLALKNRDSFARSPLLKNVPVQAMTIGQLKILGLPGEIFSGIGLNLQKSHRPLMPVGYANGDIGYIPTRKAYRDATDYACYCAPMFYQLFPFTPEIEGIFLRESRKLLR